MQNNSLFSEFEPVSGKQWKQQIQVDLKGADYNETLVWESLEGISVKPFYNEEDAKDAVKFSLPENHDWSIAQLIYVGNTAAANKKAINILYRGAQSLVFQLPNPSIDWSELFNGVSMESTTIYVHFEFLDIAPIKSLQEFVGNKKVQIHLSIDLLGNLARSGNWFHSQEKDHQLLDEIIETVASTKGIHVLEVDTSLYQNAGANMVQQLAYSLLHANEYLNHLVVTLREIKKATPITFKVSVGSNYFFETAKLKALRWLWKTLATEYGIESDCNILAIPSKRNKTLYDYNVNMLRTTSECMSTVLGGANTVCNLSYDAIFHKDNEFGERIARNQLLLLKEESYFDEAVHAAEGNYYIESLTQSLAEKALELFKKIEASGGLLKQLNEGIIQQKIKESAAKEQELFDNGELVLLGTNKFQNPQDKMKDDLELYPFIKTDKRQTAIEPIIEKRLAEEVEQKRLEDE